MRSASASSSHRMSGWSFGASPLPHNALDPASGVAGRLVLPHAHDGPACPGKRGVVASVTGDVPVELGAPVAVVRSRPRPVIRTPVPVAPVDEDGNALARKDEVSP